MKLNLDHDRELTPTERLDLMTIRAAELVVLIDHLKAFGEPYQKESMLIEMADRHLLNCMEVLKGIRFGRA